MPAKYSHAKKRPPGRSKKASSANTYRASHDHRTPSIHVDRNITQAISAVSQLERAIARILLLRFEQDIARLFSTHLYCVALLHLPTFVMRCINLGGPGWVAANADCDEIKDFFRAGIGMDLRQAGERVATKSVLWSYTALRHFAMSNNVPICRKRGLHSLLLLPHFTSLKSHLDTLLAMPPAAFAKPPHLAALTDGVHALEIACEDKYAKTSVHGDWDPEWRQKVRAGYERVSQTLWRVAREFDVRGYGLVLREKLTGKWCDCGCSTDHLSEVCEKTVREDEEESGVRPGKEREWDGRGSGVFGWGTEEEEDIWDVDLDFVSLESEECPHGDHHLDDMTIDELMEWRYFRAEYEKEQGNISFKSGDYDTAIEQYKTAHQIEPEMPHYQLNMAAACLKLKRWMEAEKACDAALSQHKSVKGYWRRAQARNSQGRRADAVKDLRAVLRLQPSNTEAQAELHTLLPPDPHPPEGPQPSFISSSSTKRRSGPAMMPTPSPSASVSSLSASSLSPASSSSASASASSSSPISHLHPSSSHPLSGSSSRSTTPRPLKFTHSKHTTFSLPTFARTPADNRILKISPLPTTVDIPVLSHPGYGGGNESATKEKLRFGNGSGKARGKGKMGGGGDGGVDSSVNGGGLDREDVEYRSYSFSYPSWERYSVKRVAN